MLVLRQQYQQVRIVILLTVNVDIGRRVYAVADLYGQCTQVSTNIIYHNIVFILMY